MYTRRLTSFMRRPMVTPLLLFAVALVTRLIWLWHPSEVVFDETYFRQFTADYLSGSFFFDIHPPLAKMMLAGWAALLGYKPDTIMTSSALPLRLLPAVAGSAIIPVFYALLRSLEIRRLWAVVGAAFLILDGALLVQSRFILLDSILLLYMLVGLWLFVLSRRDQKTSFRYLAASGLFMGMAASIKWTGLGVLATVMIIKVVDYIRRRRFPKIKQLLGDAVALFLIPAAIYVGSFWLHFALLPNTGQGDAFMTERVQATLNGSAYYDPNVKVSFWEKFAHYNEVMYTSNATQHATHPYQSAWNTWPLMERPMAYWAGPIQSDGRQGHIYLFGNPAVWWLALAGLGATLTSLLFGPRWPARLRFGVLLLLVAYATDWLPFARITRPMFLYHYLFAMITSVGITMLLLDFMTMHRKDRGWPMAEILLGVTLASFIFFSPIFYGLPISYPAFHLREWLPSWI